MLGMFDTATAFNQPLTFDTSKVVNVSINLFGYGNKKPVFSPPLPPNITIPCFDNTLCTPPHYQMIKMFFQAAAFNQPLSFDASKVTTVSIYLFGVQPQQY